MKMRAGIYKTIGPSFVRMTLPIRSLMSMFYIYHPDEGRTYRPRRQGTFLVILSFFFIASISAQDSTKTDFSGRCFCDNCVKYSKNREAQKTVTKTIVEKKNPIVLLKKKEFKLNEEGASVDTGQVYILKNVRFVAEQAIFMDRSYYELDQLVVFLRKNPTVKISINGHVNGPGSPNTPYYQKLSEDRCQAVQMYLMEHGVKAGRLNKKGFGNSKMLFPAPVSEYESEANRRVEIIITAK
jgi:outer membrane protein OmpA-like peptidoglycan-associated protein